MMKMSDANWKRVNRALETILAWVFVIGVVLTVYCFLRAVEVKGDIYNQIYADCYDAGYLDIRVLPADNFRNHYNAWCINKATGEIVPMGYYDVNSLPSE